MHVEQGSDDSAALTIHLTREEIPVFRAILERATFTDTSPHMQSAALDLANDLLAETPE